MAGTAARALPTLGSAGAEALLSSASHTFKSTVSGDESGVKCAAAYITILVAPLKFDALLG